MKNIATFLLPLVVLTLGFTGCGGGSSGPKTVPVSGTLKIGGAPAGGIQITLFPVGEGLQQASANTDDSGNFTMFTGQTGSPGAMIGKYKVVLRSLATDDASYMDQGDTGEAGEDGGVAGPDQKDAKVQEKYLSHKTSDKEIEITGKTSDLVIEVE